ncbi:MAG: leucine-rich repeat protein, partial [Bacteroidales bacterium]|nr:leucine-rich repeat protein [Bacteroidales bacterium]
MINTRMSCNYVVAFLFAFFTYFTGTAANYLCFTANEDYVKISYSSADEEHKPDVRYSYDGTNWIEWTEPISLMQDEKLYVKGDNPDGFSFSDKSFTQFSISKSATVSGSVMSLIDGEGESTVIPNEYCFYSLFKGCEVTTAPELPATTLKAFCYTSMFENCYSLKVAPELPATEMEPNCYRLMFWSCSFSEAPELPAKKLAKSCYSGMFGMCMSLEETPLLPATELADSCYSGMFTLCSSLRKVVYLPAETFANGCYSEMFQICTSLNYVKVGCISLDYNGSNGATSNWMSYVEGVKDGVFIFPCGSDYDKRGASAVPVDFTIINSPVVVFQNPDGTVLRADTIACGETPNYGDTDPVLDDEHQFVKWNKELTPLTEPDIYYYIAEYKKVEAPAPGNWLCFTANVDGSYIGYENKGENNPDIQYSIDEGKSWYPLSPNERVTLGKEGDRVFIKGSNPKGFSFNDDDYTTFYMGGSVAASGSVMSLVDGEGTSTKIPNSNCFRCLFKDCSALTRAPELPATELTSSCYSLMFSGCSSLTEAPVLPATELSSSCYYYMFNGCVSMKEAPALPATQLASACYFCMFIRCESFTKAPELPATELMKHCYQGMFQECINLTEAPVLPATQMEQDCYTDMFHGCKSLVKAPALPAEELADGCYHSMFLECTSLTEAPQLPAMELKKQCYRKMFSGCTSLTTAPELPSESLVESCYSEMFKGCTGLNYIKVGVMSLDNEVDATENWVSEINGKGRFEFPCGTKYNKHGESEVPYNFTIIGHAIVIFQYSDDEELWRDTVSCGVVPEYNGPAPEEPEELEFIGWNKTLTEITKPGEYRYTALYRQQAPSNWLCFTAEETNSTFYLLNENGNSPSVEYSLDGGETWQPMIGDQVVTIAEIGDKVYLRGNNPKGFSNDLSSYSQFVMTGSIAASGSVMSLIDGSGVSKEIPNDYCFLNLFKYCRSLTQAPELPATTLSKSCYEEMFEGCSRLTVAPELPATQLTTNCYNSMFASCESLMATPDLPATELAPACYGTMFAYCRNLTKAPDILPATVMYDHCYASMFFECVSLTDAPALPAETLAQYCYYFMFQGCTSLLTAPELPARTMKDGCYQCMFQGCTDLTQAPILISTALAPLCYSGMFNSCINLKSAPKLPATELTYACYLDMFRGCASLEKAPDLLAEKLESACYNGMFYGCENLNYIKVGVLSLDMTSDMTLSPTEDWVYGIEGEGEFIFPCGSKYNKHGKSEVPTNFTITGSPIIVFQNPDGRELWRDTISCDVIPEYGGDIPTIGAGYAFRGWDKELTQIKIPDVYYYTAVYDEIVDPLANKWLCFTAGKDDSEVWYGNGANNAPNIQYSLDGGVTWIEWTPDTHIKLKKDAKVYVRGNNPDGFSHDKGNATIRDAKDLECTYFQMKGSIAASGNVMSLIDEEGSTTTIPCVGCFSHLFVGCGSLTQAPNLPAMDLTERCYESMFLGCSNLIEAPELPATTMADFCYGNMFSGCRKLSKAPVLPALKLAGSCYVNMFNNANLTEAPELPATELTYRCYANMFSRCANLVKAPALPAQELTNFCYELMFSYCTSLTEAPELPATTLVSSCYKDMFKECTNLNYIKVGVMTLDNDVSATREWVSGIDGPGVFIFPCGSKYNKHGASEVPTNFDIVASPIVVFQNYDGTELWRDTVGCDVVPEYKGDTPSRGDAYEFIGWDKDLTILTEPDVYYYKAVYEKKSDPLYNNWLCFTAEGEECSVGYTINGEGHPDMQYSVDNGKTWEYLAPNVELVLAKGEKVYFKGINPDGLSTEESQVRFTTYNELSVSGSVMSLIDGEGTVTEIPNPYCFYRLFYQNLHLTAAPELSATVLTEGCYRQMFAYCEDLTEAPVLPAVTMAERCYQDMFQHCMKLTKAPTLPAEEMERECYYGMFRDCYSLAEAPALPATTLADSCYCAMFNECHNLTKTPNLTATDMVVAAYMYMFTNCTSLTEVTSLPATHLERNCYTGMFSGCSSLVEAPALPATTLADSCYTVMFAGCRNMQTPPELPAEELSRSCYEYMFTACSSIVEAPVLPATILKPFCYAGMFAGCTYLEKVPEIAMTSFAEQSCFLMFNGCYNLNYIKVGANTLDNEYEATLNWVVAIKNPGVFVFPCGSKYDKHGDSEVPVNFEIQSSPIVVFQNPDGRELYRDTIACDVIPEYIGDEPTYGEGLFFVGWDKPLTVLTDLNTYYFTAVYEEDQPVSGNWLCFTAEKAESEVWYENNTFEEGPDVQYSLDGGRTWNPLAPNEHIVLKSENDKVYFKGDNPDGFSRSEDGEVLSRSTTFRMSGSIAASGSVMSLVDGEGTSTVIPNDFCFASLFEGCLSLTKAPELPATTLTRGCYEEMFRFCDDLVYAPELPALQMAEECYVAMFAGCVKLTKAPALPAKTLATRCYYGMFADCYYLVDVPELPATNLAEACYGYMFRGCTSLTDAPVLPATVMATSCYTMMFKDCYALVEAPELPATTLEDDCYSSMFSDCSHLEKAPALPAEILSTFCYEEMFARCKRLTTAPELPAKELKSSCYQNMFNGCTNLNYIKVGVMSLDNDDEATLDWVKGIDGEGVFIFPCGSKYDKHGVSEVPDNFKIISSPVVVFQNPDGEELYRDTIGCDVVAEYRGETPSYGDGLVFKGWDPELTIHPEPDTFYYTAVYEEELTPITDVSKCLCFTAAEKGSEVWCQNHGNNAPDIQYSVDEGRTWIPLAADEHVVLNSVDDKVYFKGINPEGFSHGDSDYTFFEMSGMIAASGSVMSLLDGEGVSNVIPNESCFRYLFGGCASLTKAPELPATTLSKACYMGMFSRCSRLTDMPELPATTLADSCYSDMFSECSKLIKTTELPATTLTEGCYESMFYKCISLTDAPELPATTLAKGCYNSMFYNCTSLTEAPELPATTLAVGCYNGMFYGCSSLTKAPELPATTLMDGCYYDMFNGCTSLTEAPELPAAELVNECYYSMFRGCSNLTYIKVGVMTLDGFGASSYWVYDVKKEGTFIFPCGSKYDKHGISEVPVNFKIISSPVVIFQNPDGGELYRDTIACDVVAEYKGETPTYGEGLVFKGWDKELTVHPEPDTFYYTAVYEEELT